MHVPFETLHKKDDGHLTVIFSYINNITLPSLQPSFQPFL